MGVFLYYLPELTQETATRERLQDSPLADVLRDALVGPTEFSQRVQIRTVFANGPDRGNGVVIAPVGRDPHSPQQIGVYRHQEWHSWLLDRYWIGIDPNFRPTPDDLARPGMLTGYDVRLGNLTWHVPTIRRGGKFPTLPQTMRQSPDGLFEMQLRREWEPIWQQSGTIFDQWFHPGSYPWQTVFALCASMLGVNYRVGLAECSLLELLDTTNWEEVYKAVIDWPLIQELLIDRDKSSPNEPAPALLAAAGEPNSCVGSAA